MKIDSFIPLFHYYRYNKESRNKNPGDAESLNCRLITIASWLGHSLVFLLHGPFLPLSRRRLVTFLRVRVLRGLRILSLNIRMGRRIDVIIYFLPVGIYQTGPHFVAGLELYFSFLLQGLYFFFVQDITILIPIFYPLFGAKNTRLF